MQHETLLLQAESSFGWMSGMPSGNLATYFQGPIADAQKRIEERLKEILKLNPWLLGRLHKTSEGHGIALRWSDEDLTQELDAIDQGQSSIFHIDPKELSGKLHLNQSYEAITKIALKSSFAVPVGKVCLKKNRPLCSIILSKTDDNAFVMQISISHIIADGYTAYAILNMLLVPGVITALDPKRDQSFNDKLKEALGHKEKSLLDFSLPGILNAIGKFLFLRPPKGYFFKVNMDAIEQEKKTAQANDPDAPRLSTNDILSSTLARMMRFTSLYMAINFRRRFTFIGSDNKESKGETLAGNYESGILFFEGDFNHPIQIRTAQGKGPDGRYQRPPNKSGALSPIPGFWKRTFGRPGIITNWAGWDANFELPNAEPILFVPLNELDKPFFETAIIFKPRPGEVGVMLYSRQLKDINAIKDFSPIFGDTFSDTLFPE